MIRIPLQVEYADGTIDSVLTNAKDGVEFERKYDKPYGALAEGRIEYMYYLAWVAITRIKKTDLPFDDWLDTVADLVDGVAEEIVPLERSQPTGS
jgi:hypothetical protein